MIRQSPFRMLLHGRRVYALYVAAAAILLAAACAPPPAVRDPTDEDEFLDRRPLLVYVAGTADSVEFHHIGSCPILSGRAPRRERLGALRPYYHSCMFYAYTGQTYRVSVRNLGPRGRVEVHLVEVATDPPYGRRLIGSAVDSGAYAEVTVTGVLK